MQYGSKAWAPWVEDDEEKVFSILKRAYDLGIRTFDTADAYSNGESEKLLGKFLKKYNIKRDKVVIMTKAYLPVDDAYGPDFYFGALDHKPKTTQIDFVNNKGLSRKHLMDAIQGSLKRLDVDYVDVYQIHRYDPETPPKETMKALNDIVDMGLTRYIGASSMKAVEFVELQHIAELNNWHKLINMQSRYNLLEREDEHEVNYYCDKTGVGLTPYFALASGTLARPVPTDENHLTHRAASMAVLMKPLTMKDQGATPDIEIVNRVEELAKKKSTKMSCVALAWLVSKGCTPIAGIGSLERLEDLARASEVYLTEDEIKYLEEPYQPKLRTFIGLHNSNR